MRLKTAISVVDNICSGFKFRLSYVIEHARWSIREDGRQIVEQLNKQKLIRSRLSEQYLGLWGQIVHFGCEHVLFKGELAHRLLLCGRPRVLTVFHVVKDWPGTQDLIKLCGVVETVHTTCELTVKELVRLGVPRVKIVKVPLGVDTVLFHPPTAEERAQVRRDLNIQDSAIAVGSFQKDGSGWGDGSIPKLIKGPDIFCDVIERLARRFLIHVVLTGPARGYVKNRLDAAGISYTHRYEEDFRRLFHFYHALDLYLVASLNEGGPKAILESMASGVPLVTSAVGMAPEVIRDGVNGFLCPPGDAAALANAAEVLIESPERRTAMARAGLETITNYRWEEIAARYFREIYSPLISGGAR